MESNLKKMNNTKWTKYSVIQYGRDKEGKQSGKISCNIVENYLMQ